MIKKIVTDGQRKLKELAAKKAADKKTAAEVSRNMPSVFGRLAELLNSNRPVGYSSTF